MKHGIANILAAGVGILASATLVLPAKAGDINVKYLYSLSDFSGTIPYSTPRLSLDERNSETYVISGESIQVFNASGMEIYRFEHDSRNGTITDAAVDEEGRILLLVNTPTSSTITICNFRGEPTGVFELKNIPQAYADNRFSRIIHRNGQIFLASMESKKIIVTDRNGVFTRSIDLADLLKPDAEEMERIKRQNEQQKQFDPLGQGRDDYEIGTIAVDQEGRVLLSLPIKGRVLRIAADGTIQMFGKRGSAPGRFGIPSGVAVDSSGNIYISDRLRCVVLAFDKDLKFITEFGFRGFGPGNLIGPSDVLVDASDRVYVTQLRERGVNVYQTKTN